MATVTTIKKAKKARTQKQTEINEVPLPEPFQKKLDAFLLSVKYDAHESGSAFVIVFRPSEPVGGVDVNVASWGLTDKLQNKMLKAALVAIDGVPLYHYVDESQIKEVQPFAK
jgi:hypothetical protein